MDRNKSAITPTAESKIQYTTEDGFLMTIPQDLEYNKTECTDVSIISTTEAQPKMPLVAVYPHFSSSSPIYRKDQTKKLSSETQGSKIRSIPSPNFFPIQEEERNSVPKLSLFPKESSSFLDTVKPKILVRSHRSEAAKPSDLSQNVAEGLNLKFTSKKIVHTNSSDDSSGTSLESPAAEYDRRISNVRCEKDTNFNETESLPKRHSNRLNPWNNQTSINSSHQPPLNVQNSKRTSGNFSWQIKRLASENNNQSRAESTQLNFTKRTSLFKFFQGGRQPSSQALGMINDKSYFHLTDPKTPKVKSIRRNSIPTLTRLLRKHAVSGEMSHSGTQLFNVLAILKKRKMGFFGKFRISLGEVCIKLKQSIKIMLKSLRYFLKPLRPEGLLRCIWDGVILIFIVISLITVPFNLCFRFSNSVIEDDGLNFLTGANIAIFLLDILVNFHTAYYLDGSLEFESKSIALNYLKNWFFFDLLASLPYQLIGGIMEEPDQVLYSQNGKAVNPFKSKKFLMKFLCVLQLVRVFKLQTLLAKFESFLDLNRFLIGILSLVKLFLMVAFIAHWCACGWHLIAVDLESSDWLTRVGLDEATIEDRYIASLYFCLTTLLTVGFGDIAPQSSVERVYTMVVMLLGGCVFGYVMNSIAVILYFLEDEKTKLRNKITSLCKYMQKEGLAKDVQQDIKKYLEFLIEGRNAMKQSDKEMLEMVSQDLRGRFYEQMNGKLLYGSKLLANNFTKRVLYSVSAAIEERTYTPQEKIFDHLDTDGSVYYISRGCVDFFHITATSPVMTLKSGATFGEISFFTNLPRTLAAKSVEFSRLLFIRRTKFLETLEGFPQDREMFCMIKDRIVNYQEFSILELKCSICQENDHLLEKCPQIRYVPDMQEILRNHLERVATFKKDFRRGKRTRFHVLKSLKLIEIASLDLYKTHFEKLLEINGPEDPSICLEEAEERRTRSIGRPSISLPLHNNKSQILSESVNKNLRFSTLLVKDASRDVKGTWIPPFQSRKIIQEKTFNAQMTFKIKDGELIPVDSDEIDLENFEFDRVMAYPVYFPHNNVNKIVDRMEKKERVTVQSSEEIKKLKHHLKRFFKALEKQRAREKLAALPLRRGRSRSILKLFEK